ncbi:DinB family protein [Brevibacillus sp. B_LB10_24]|uniref:DinB family protein n=1 Tax=Brevibacillus sp. B_LB10_24 TaxID=3380645 RepID=UPI0038BD34E5
MKHNALELYDYHLWANQKVFQHLKELPQEVLHQEIQSVFPTLFAALVHIYRVENVWLLGMSSASYEEIVAVNNRITEETEGKSLEEIEQLFAGIADRYQSFFADKDLDAVKAYPHPQFGTLMASYADIIQHLVNHGTYHRGNITAMLRQLGYAGVPTDYVFYLYERNS